MFKKLLTSSLCLITSIAAAQYGIVVRNIDSQAKAFDEIEKIATIGQLSTDPSEFGMEIETGMPVWLMKSYNEAVISKKRLNASGYTAEIIDVKLDLHPQANVMSLEAMMAMAEQLNEMLTEEGIQ